MAASELIEEEEEVRIPVEANVTSPNSPTQIHPQRVANGNPTRPASALSDGQDGHDGRGDGGGGLCSLMLMESLSNKLKRRCDYEKIKAEPGDSLPSEWWKTGVAFLYAAFNLVFTTVIITVVHERVPDKSVSPPLPDKFFDYVDRVPWAFTITETNGLILVGLWLVQWLLLKHKYDRWGHWGRWGRWGHRGHWGLRVPWAFTITETNGLILVGLWLVQWLLLKHKYDRWGHWGHWGRWGRWGHWGHWGRWGHWGLRVPWAFTITETNGLILVGLWLVQWLLLKHKAIVGRRCFFLIGTLYMYRCLTMYITTLPVPGKHMVCAPKLYNDSTGKIWRILRLISGGGLSLTSSHLMCGDFLYSGHTVMLTLSYLFIQEYSPRWMWWYRWACWILSASGVVCILIGHEHYSIDVVIAYYVTTRVFWWYHTMANNHDLRGASTGCLTRVWWNPVFNFLERNVQTTVPVVFLSPRALLSSCKERYHTMGIERDE